MILNEIIKTTNEVLVEEFEIEEEENTLSILSRYIEESEIELDKNIVKGIFKDL